MTLPADLAATRQFIKYLEDKVEAFNKVIDEFPKANCEMDLPTCSVITVGTPVFTNLQTYTLREEEDEDNSNNILEYSVIGQYDSRYQVDIWADSKIQRSRLMESVIDSMNEEFLQLDRPCGLSLKMEDYHDVIARYDQVGYTYIDGEENSQKDQWRVKLDLIVNYPKVAVRSIPKISEITVTHDISADDNLDIEENFTV